MKKLLSLLSTLTITGTALPTTIDASLSPYQKEEQNFDILHRFKRGNDTKKKTKINRPSTIDEKDDNHPSTSGRNNNRCGNRSGGVNNQRCRKPNEESSLITTKSARERFLDEIENNSNNIFETSKRENKYGFFIRKTIDYFKETNNIVEETTHPDTNWKIYKIEKHNVEDSYKKIPLKIDVNKIDLILNKSNLYVDGIITHNNGSDGMDKKLWYFSDSNLTKNSESLKPEDKYKLFSKILNFEVKSEDKLKKLAKKLDFDSNYHTLTSEETNIKINKENIRGSIINLINISDATINKIKEDKEKEKTIKKDFLRVIFTTAEATRFFSVRKEVNKIITSSDNYEINWQDHEITLKNWDKNSQKYYEMKNGRKFTDEEKQKIYDISVLAVKDDEKTRKDNDNRKNG